MYCERLLEMMGRRFEGICRWDAIVKREVKSLTKPDAE